MFDSVEAAANELEDPKSAKDIFKETQEARAKRFVAVKECIKGCETTLQCMHVKMYSIALNMYHNADTGDVFIKVGFIAANGEMYAVNKFCKLTDQKRLQSEVSMRPFGLNYMDRDQRHLCREEVIELIRTIGQNLGEITRHYGLVIDSFSTPDKSSNGHVSLRIANGVFVGVDYYHTPAAEDEDWLPEDVGRITIMINHEFGWCLLEHRFNLYIDKGYLRFASDEMIKHLF